MNTNLHQSHATPSTPWQPDGSLGSPRNYQRGVIPGILLVVILTISKTSGVKGTIVLWAQNEPKPLRTTSKHHQHRTISGFRRVGFPTCELGCGEYGKFLN